MKIQEKHNKYSQYDKDMLITAYDKWSKLQSILHISCSTDSRSRVAKKRQSLLSAGLY